MRAGSLSDRVAKLERESDDRAEIGVVLLQAGEHDADLDEVWRLKHPNEPLPRLLVGIKSHGGETCAPPI